MRYYDSNDEVRRRLQNGVVLYKGEPVFVVDYASVKGAKAKFGVTIRDYPNAEKSWKVALDDPDLNFRQIRLGFLNSGETVFRAIRWPHRGVQQSLSDSNCFVEELGVKGRMVDREEGGYVSLNRLLRRGTDAIDSFAGRFPSREQARRDVTEGRAKARAFHYDWAYQIVMGVPALWHKTRPVCLTMDANRILKLEEGLTYMKEPLEELGMRI